MTDHDFGFRTDFYTFAPETLAEELSDYEILREVGKGSMGIVYEATRKADGTRVALKVLPPSLTLTDRALARFVKEGEVMARIEHPGIVRVYEHGQKGRLHFFAMEFVDGPTLEQRVRVGPLPVRQAAAIGCQLAAALQYAHDHGVVHRDVKPGNIILGADDRVAITDFGLARETGAGSFTESGAIVGTPMYMAPEQILGHRDDIDTRADVYGLSATLYEMVTGTPPFTAPTAQAVLKAVLERDPPRPTRLRQDVPEDFEAVVLRGLEKRPSRRYGSCQELADDLQRFLRGERVLAPRRTLAHTALRAIRTHKLATSLLLIIGVLAVIGLSLDRERRLARVERLIRDADLHYTKATSRENQLHGFRAPTAEEQQAYFHKALALATGALAESPESDRALIIRAKVQAALRAWPEALADLDRAAAQFDAPQEEVLRLRLGVLQELDDPTSKRRLMRDLMELLQLDRGTDTLLFVADYLLGTAYGMPPGPERAGVLDRVEQMLAQVPRRSGPAAIAGAMLLQLRGADSEAREATEQACLDFPGMPLVHERAAQVYRALGDDEAAEQEASMARLLRGDGARADAAPPGREPGAALDTGELKTLLQGLGRLFGPRDGSSPDK